MQELRMPYQDVAGFWKEAIFLELVFCNDVLNMFFCSIHLLANRIQPTVRETVWLDKV